ncbi:hypothetical protein ACFL3V_06315 [Nanoarchaeota archaeon]
MEKRHVIIGILVISLFLLGCSAQKTPDLVCNKPYIRYGNGCCMDQNSNNICDDDDDGFFEPEYVGGTPIPKETVTYEEEDDYDPSEFVEEDSVVDEVVSEPVVVEVPEEEVVVEEVTVTKSKFTTPEPKPSGWIAEHEGMSISVEGITFEVRKKKTNYIGEEDTEVWLKEMKLHIKNKDYVYLHPKIKLKVHDWKDNIIRDTMLCDASDDILMMGCDSALPRWESMDVTMKIDQRIDRPGTKKTFFISMENKRDTRSSSVLEIKKEDIDVLNFVGAVYV